MNGQINRHLKKRRHKLQNKVLNMLSVSLYA